MCFVVTQKSRIFKIHLYEIAHINLHVKSSSTRRPLTAYTFGVNP